MRHWKVTIKEVGCPRLLTPELEGDYELEDVRQYFGLDKPDVEWYQISELTEEQERRRR
jgi:hypothetical protein